MIPENVFSENMGSENLRRLLMEVQAGRIDIEAALQRLRDLPYENIGAARLDHHRELRTGLPEVVFGQGKTPPQVAEIMSRLARHTPVALTTRADPSMYAAVHQLVPDAVYFEQARIIALGQPSPPTPGAGYIAIVTGGTADMPVAEEAAVTAEMLGHYVERIYDVGVAGIHRVLDQRQKLYEAAVVIVIAGMEGALASVVGGLVACPVVAVPTSVGYGASFGGLAALLSMLNSCAPGIAVVNIDNGFGAAAFAHLILRRGSASTR